MYLAVTCKNVEYHKQDNPFGGYRIRIHAEHLARFRVTCDRCEKTYSYDPEDVLHMQGD